MKAVAPDGLEVRRYRLENGLTVLVSSEPAADVVAILTYVKAGYFDEPDEVAGISHVLEHMYFKGTRLRGPGELARGTKAVGGYLNAGTIYDRTSYYTVLPVDALERGLELQSDALKNLAIDEAELRRELRVIIEESKRKRDTPAAVAAESLYAAMFGQHPMGRWRIGSEEVLSRLGRKEVAAFYRAHYTPSNIVLVLAGGVEPERGRDLAAAYYGDMATAPVAKRSLPHGPSPAGLRVREIAGDIVHAHLEWGWPTPPTSHRDTPALDMLATMLGSGRGAHLYQMVRERGLVRTISAYNYTPTELGVFGISAALDPAQTLSALRATWVAVSDVARHGVESGAVERARGLLAGSFLRRLERVEGRAGLLAEWEALGDWRLAERYLDSVLAVRAADLRRVARRYLRLDRATVLCYRPRSAPTLGLGADEVAADLDRTAELGSEAGERQKPYGVKLPAGQIAAPNCSDAAGAATPRPDRVEDGVYLYDLPGARVAVRRRTTAPLVSMGFFYPGGRLLEPADRTGLAGLVARASVKGTRGRSALRIAMESEALGGVISPLVGSDALSWTFTLPSRHFHAGFRLLADVVLRQSLPEREVERERRMALSDLQHLRDDMYRYPLRLLMEAAFPGHPYGASLAESESGLRAAMTEDLQEWHAAQVRGGRPWVIAVGDVEPDAVAAAVAAEVDAPIHGAAPVDHRRPAEPTRGAVFAERPGKAQTAIAIACPGAARGDDARFTDIVLSSVVSGLGGRFFEELRGTRSLAYSVAAYPITRWLAGLFVAYVATSTDREAEARRALFEQFAALAAEGVSTAELERAKNYSIGSWKVRQQTHGAQLTYLADALLLGKGTAELADYEDRVRAVTAERVRDRVARAVAAGAWIEGVVRGTGARAG